MLDKRTVKILDFLREIEKLKLIERINYLSDKKRRENDAEHSWYLAMMIMAFENELSVKFDALRALKIALVHDIAEIGIGDDWATTKEAKSLKQKAERESAKKIFNKLPKDLDKEFYSLWQEYENGKTIEAKVAKGMDKISYSLQYAIAQKIEWNKKTSIHESREYALPHIDFDKKLIDILDSLLKEVVEFYEPENEYNNA